MDTTEWPPLVFSLAVRCWIDALSSSSPVFSSFCSFSISLSCAHLQEAVLAGQAAGLAWCFSIRLKAMRISSTDVMVWDCRPIQPSTRGGGLSIACCAVLPVDYRGSEPVVLLSRAALQVYNPSLRLSPLVLGVHHTKWPARLPRYQWHRKCCSFSTRYPVQWLLYQDGLWRFLPCHEVAT